MADAPDQQVNIKIGAEGSAQAAAEISSAVNTIIAALNRLIEATKKGDKVKVQEARGAAEEQIATARAAGKSIVEIERANTAQRIAVARAAGQAVAAEARGAAQATAAAARGAAGAQIADAKAAGAVQVAVAKATGAQVASEARGAAAAQAAAARGAAGVQIADAKASGAVQVAVAKAAGSQLAAAAKGAAAVQMAEAKAAANVQVLSAKTASAAQIAHARAAAQQQVVSARLAAQTQILAARQAQTAQRGLTAGSASLGNSYARLYSGAIRLRTILGTLGGAIGLREIIEAGVEYNRIINTLTAGTGNLRRAFEEFAFIKQVAQDLGLSLNSVAVEFSKFLAAVKGTTLAGQAARDVFVSVSEATLVLGLSADRTQRVFLALSQMASQTYVTAENLRQQFAEHIPGAMIIAARSMSLTNDEFYKALYRGKILATDLIPKMAKGMHELFGPAVQRAQESMIGKMNRLETAWQNAMRSIAEGVAGNSIKDAMVRLTDFLNMLDEAPGKIEAIGNAAKAALTLITGLFAASKILGWASALEKAAVIAGSSKWAFLLTKLTAIRAVLTTPLGIAGLIVGLGSIGMAGYDYVEETVESYQNSFRALSASVEGFKKQQEELRKIEMARGNTQMSAEEQKAWSEQQQQLLEPFLRDGKQAIDIMKTLTQTRGMQVARSGALGPGMKQDVAEIDKAKGALIAYLEMFDKAMERGRTGTPVGAPTETNKPDLETARELWELQFKITEEKIRAVRATAMENKDYDLARQAVEAEVNMEREKIRIMNQFATDKAVMTDAAVAQAQALKEIEVRSNANGEINLALLRDQNAEREKAEQAQERLNAKIEKQKDLMGEAVIEAENALQEQLNSMDLERETPFETGLRRANEAVRELKLKTEDYYKSLKDPAALAAYDAQIAKVHELTQKTEALKAAQKEWSESLGGQMVELWDEAIRDMQNALSGFFSNLLSGSKDVWTNITDSLLQLFVKMISNMLAEWITFELTRTAITAEAAAARAGMEAAAGGSGSSGSSAAGMMSYWKTFKGLYDKWFGGASTTGSSAAASAAATNAAYSQWATGASSMGQAGQGAVIATESFEGVGGTGATAGSGAAGGMTAASWGMIYAAAIVIGLQLYGKKKAYDRAYGTAAGATVDESGLHVGFGGEMEGTGRIVAEKLGGLLKALEGATGTFYTGMDKITIKIRNDKKYFDAFVGDQLVGTFGNMNEAIVAAAKKAFSTAEFAEAINPIFQSMVESFEGTDPEALAQAAQIAQGILEASSGLSEMGRQITNLLPSLHGLTEQLMNLGVSAYSAAQLTMEAAATQFTALHHQLTGYEESRAEQLKRKQEEAALFNAQLELYRLELQMKRQNLVGELELIRADLEIKKQEMTANRQILEGKAAIAEGNINLGKAEVRAEYALLQAKAAILEKTIEILDKTFEILSHLDIDVGSITLGPVNVPDIEPPKPPKPQRDFNTGANRINEASKRWKEAVDDFRDAIHEARYNEATSPLTDRERLQGQASDFMTLMQQARSGNLTAMQDLPEAYRELLEAAKAFSGGGTGLAFLGFGDTFKEFWATIEQMSIDLTNMKKPGKIYERNVIFDERMTGAVNEGNKEKKKHREENKKQLESIILATQSTAESTNKTKQAVEKLTQASQNWGAA